MVPGAALRQTPYMGLPLAAALLVAAALDPGPLDHPPLLHLKALRPKVRRVGKGQGGERLATVENAAAGQQFRPMAMGL